MFITRSVAVCRSSMTVMAKKVSIGEEGRLSLSSMNCVQVSVTPSAPDSRSRTISAELTN